MVEGYSEEQRQAAKVALEAGADILEVAAKTGVPVEVLLRWFKFEFSAAQAAQRKSGGGRKPVIDEAGLQVLRTIVETKSRLTLDELAAAFTEITGKVVKSGPINKAMKTLGYRKVKPQKALSQPAPQSKPRYTEAHRREPTPTAYPSTMTDREWQVMEPHLAKKDARGRPAKIEKRVLVDAIFYQVRTGCPWRYLPKDFPHWQAVWSLFRRLRDSGMLERMYDSLHEEYRRAIGRTESPTGGIVDSQTVKTTEKGAFAAATTRARRSRGASATWSSIPSDFLAQS